VTISMIGYRTVTKTDVLVNADRTTTLDVMLEPVTLEAGEVVVTAQRPLIVKDLTASEQVLTGQELQKSWVRTVTEAVETQAGVFQSYFRGSSQLQAVYMIDNLATNSGLLSDNYSGFNTSTIQEISVLTGGYNAEYGDARSAVINIVTKEATSGVHGSVLTRMRPAGIYHFGRHIYSKENYDYAFFDLDYWTARSRDTISTQFYGIPPEELLAAWRSQIAPNDTLANYDKRAEYEVEGTMFGALSEDLSFLLSGRYKRGVGIFPQAIPYNPEFNIQGYVNYKISPEFKVRLGGFWGGWESAEFLGVNFNSLESAQESQWLAPMQITQPYSSIKYAPMGAIYRQWPELRRWEQYYIKVTHLLSPESFYDLSLSYLHDQMDRSDRYNAVPVDSWSRRDDQMKIINRFLDRGYFHTWDKNFSKLLQLKADYTGQMTTHHQVKSGFTLKFYDFSYEHFMGVHEGGNRWNLLNVFTGHPYEGNLYVQDKIEFPGLIVNAGVRVDYFHQNRLAPKNLFDPLAFQPTTPGHDPSEPLGYPGTPEREPSKPQIVVAPRLGISHPISDNAVLHFVYGHFYQRPSWTKMFGFPFVNYTTDMSKVLDPYADQITYMEEWQGWYGNPEMGFERTIHYELGIDYNLADMVKLDITGYYKDGSREANVITGVYAAQYVATKALMMSNSGYSDIRGIETKLDTRIGGPFNAGISHDILWSFAG
ncbi:MAG: TonB-dependent receptor, partial [Ignavibacteriales bacterium]|nr:TonB-dependent receptor [Ignavibacteriales bacterium]